MSRYSIRRIFNPTPEEQEEDRQKFLAIFKELAKDRDCVTCSHHHHVIDYPGFVIGEECECNLGLECDTVLYTKKNCPGWEEEEI